MSSNACSSGVAILVRSGARCAFHRLKQRRCRYCPFIRTIHEIFKPRPAMARVKKRKPPRPREWPKRLPKKAVVACWGRRLGGDRHGQ